KTLLTGDRQGMVRLWDLSGASAKERFTHGGHMARVNSVSLARTGMLASGGMDAVRLWNLAYAKAKEPESALAWGTPVLSRNGNIMALGKAQGEIEVWTMSEKPQKRWHRPAHRLERVSGLGLLEISPDGKTL